MLLFLLLHIFHLYSNRYDYQRLIEDINLPLLDDFKTFMKDSIQPLHSMMRMEIVNKFEEV